jgi:hypothetical protein
MQSPARLTAQLAERLRSDLPGYAVSLVAHPAHSTAQLTRVARIAIAEPHLEAVCWVDVADGAPAACDAPLSASRVPEIRVVEIRVIVHVPGFGGAPAALVGDRLEFDGDDIPVEETLAAIARLIDDDLAEECTEGDRATYEAFEAGRFVYLNDWPG